MALLSHAEEPEREAAMDKHKKQSQDMFDEELRHEMREAEEAQKRVWEKIQKMSPEERRKMAAGVPGPEDREELPLGTSYKPMPRRRLGGAIKVGALAAAALLVVISSGTFSIGNKEHEYHVDENNGKNKVNNSEVYQVEENINFKIMMVANSLREVPIEFSYWPNDIEIENTRVMSDDGYGIIECSYKNSKIYLECYRNIFEPSRIISGEIKEIKEIKNADFMGSIKLYENSDYNEEKTYTGIIILENGYYSIGKFEDRELLEKILEGVKSKKN